MTISSRDAAATIFVAAGLLLALSVLQGWGWPLMNGTRMGIIALGLAGMCACSVSGWARPDMSWTSPFVMLGIVLGVIALGAGLAGLFAGSTVFLTLMMAATGLLWLVTVVHRLFTGTTVTRPIMAA